MIATEIRDVLTQPGRAEELQFEILKSIGALLRIPDQDRETAQELILRALETRDSFSRTDAFLTALVREVGLFPYLDPEHLETRDLIAYEFCRPEDLDELTVFHYEQAEIYIRLMSGQSIVLSAPTSFGKSLIIDAIIASRQYNNIVIVVPTIALIDETRKRLSTFRDNYKIITHSHQIQGETNIFILTQERVIETREFPPIDFFVIDEFYKLAPREDIERSPILNHAFYKLLKHNAQFYMLGPNIEAIPHGFEEAYNCVFFQTDYRTVVSNYHDYYGGEETKLERLMEVCDRLHDPTLIFCSSPGSVRKVARALVEAEVGSEAPQLRNASEWVSREYHPEWLLGRCLSLGIGLHHGKIPRPLQQYQVRMFNDGYIRFLICTSTLIEGVNTSAKNVIIYDNTIARRKFDFFTFNNIVGRSGRMFQHFTGDVYLFHPPPMAELPFVDVPILTQGEDTPTSLLVQLDEEDLSGDSRLRMETVVEGGLLPVSLLREIAGVDPGDLNDLAREIDSNPSLYGRLLRWEGRPTYDQLRMACDLIYQFFVKVRRIAAVSSGSQLAYRVNKLSTVPGIPALVEDEIEFSKISPDDAVDAVLEFQRHWAGYKFPKLLSALDRVQRFILERHGLRPGDYSGYCIQVENLFMDSAIIALDEYGIPYQSLVKLGDWVQPEGDLDTAIAQLHDCPLNRTLLTDFERDLIQYNLQFL
ncbi:DEAD/DEAH box helicase [Gemmatimonadota bacterium]